MKIYSVGGAVRDELLGLPVKDHDYVVVGATPEDMVKRGYKPVGREFPVFLHPDTHEEYALARTERKVARGYHGFEFRAAPDVTLEQDLERRDLTINALARDERGVLIDPYGGVADLQAGVLRHVSAAFAEDPVRILRVARFAARFGFEVAPATRDLMRQMVAAGEADALVPERVWQEFARGLMEPRPSRMFLVLRDCGALARVAPEFEALFADEEMGAGALAGVDTAAETHCPLEVRFGVLVRSLDPLTVEALCSRLKTPAACRDLGLLAARHSNAILDASELDAEGLLELFEATDALRRPERFEQIVAAVFVGGSDETGSRRATERGLAAAAGVDAGAIARAGGGPEEIRACVRAARLEAIRKVLGRD
jgi:tRNA nucleotidyltransferase (CCA-adding enzyme)